MTELAQHTSIHQRATARADLAPFTIADHVLARVNPTPMVSLTAAEAGLDAKLLAEVVELSALQAASAGPLCDSLHALAPQVDKHTRQRVVLPLKRAIHNGYLPRRVDRAAVQTEVADPGVHAWLERQDLIEELEDALAAAHNERLEQERAQLRAALHDEHLTRGLALSSELLPRAAEKYRAAPWAQVSKGTRKSEESLLRYAMRAGTKTSPFSHYTVTGFLTDLPGHDELHSEVEVNRGLIRRLQSALRRVPAVRDRLSVHVSTGLRIVDGRFVSTGDRDRLGPQAAAVAQRYGEAKVTAPVTPAARAVVSWLGSQDDGSATFAEVVDLITRSVSRADRARVTGFVNQLLDTGVLGLRPPVLESAPKPLGALDDWLAPVDDPTVAEVRDHLNGIQQAQDAFADADPDERVRLLRVGRGHRDAALLATGENLDDRPAPEPIWFEDVSTDTSLCTRADWHPVLEECRALADVLHLFDEQHVFSRVLAHRFVSRYGEGGICTDLDDLAEFFVPAYEDALRITEGFDHDLIGSDPVLARLVPLQRQVVARVVEQLRTRGPADLTPVDLDPALADLIAAQAPAWIDGAPSSYSFFLQALEGDPSRGAVINKIYNGWGNYVSRFLTAAPSAVADGVRRIIREHHHAGTGDAVTAELRPVQGFNANLHPLLAEEDLDWDDSRPPRSRPLSRLVARHDASLDRVVLHDPVRDQRVHPLYLGFLIPYYLPSRLLPLTAVGGSGSIFFEPQVSADREPHVNRDQIRRYPPIRYGSVHLSRARWHVPSALVPRRQSDEDEGRFFVRLNRWRLEEGIPEHVFVHPPAPEFAPGQVDDYFGSYMDNRKPQYVDLLSRLHVRYLDRLLDAQPGIDVVVEHARPDPTEYLLGPDGRHAVEVVAELYRKASR